MSMHWWLAIDFGTSNTAAASYEPGSGAPQVVPLSHTSDIMSSSVYADSYRNIVVGEAAVNQATNNPAAFITHPKRHIAAGTVPVGNLDLPLENLIAAVLNSALNRASERRGGTRPARLILTHPVAWSPEEIDVLTRAAELIGFDRGAVTLISEPRAAIAHYTRATADPGSTIVSKPGQTVAVVDYGGGTCDVAVVKIASGNPASGDGGPIDLIAHDGNNGLGGKNLDAMIRRWVDKQLTSRAPDLLEYLRTGANLTTKRAVDDNIRRAKELLSESPRAVINISAGGHEAILELTRGEFEELIAHNVDSVVDLTTRTLARAGAGTDVQLYLTGGSSRVPLVHRRLGELGTVATLDNPKTVVALGALEAIVNEGGAVGAPTPSVPPVAPVPLSKPATPPPAPWGAPTPPPTPASSTPAWGGGPNTPPPMPPPGPYGRQPSYASGPSPQYAAASQYAAGGAPNPHNPTPPNPNRNRNIAIIAIGAVVVLIVAGILGVALASSGDDDPGPGPTASSEPSTSSSATTTERVEPTTDTSTANASLNSDEQALADANVDLVETDTCVSIDSIDYALASIFCEPTPAVAGQGTVGAPASAIGLIEVVADTDIKALAEEEHAASNTSELYSRVVDGDTTYAYFDTFDDGTVAYIVYSPGNGTVTWWMTDSTDQAAFAEWLKSAGLCLC
ncbi:MAG: Hsp70 family protein [Gordonia sp.]|uniref:Hsp70 family protein n=1 Tax=Williamsia sp. 1138 TaxID=1903117 RepID=UPI000A100F15|nr:Hsp70 family protein [Williamsia sp. 1138]MBA4025609.1 Hsp70 family protein [Gordonia sp. (in: high G+C Gram-positive bacteria)]OZG28988.1 hypothetical protein BH683_011290 [Williamsia sp. 1138]